MPVKQLFRFSFWYLWLRLTFLSMVLVVISTSISQLGSGNGLFNFDQISFIVLISSGMAIFSMLAVFTHIYYFPIVVDSEGIGGHMGNGRRNRIAWSDLDSVRPVRHIGLACYSLHSKRDNSRIIIPRCLKKQSDFEAILAKRGVVITDKEPEAAPPEPVPSRRSRPSITPIREGGYIIISTEQRNR